MNMQLILNCIYSTKKAVRVLILTPKNGQWLKVSSDDVNSKSAKNVTYDFFVLSRRYIIYTLVTPP